jgi:hypothetical protein
MSCALGRTKPLVTTGEPAYPQLVWNGDGYGLAWERGGQFGRGISFSLLDTSGNLMGMLVDVVPTPDAHSIYPSLAWMGGSYALVFQKNDATIELYAMLLGAGGLPQDAGAPVLGTRGSPTLPSIAWASSANALATVYEQGPQLFGMTLDSSLVLHSPRIQLNVEMPPHAASVASNGTDFAAAWRRDGGAPRIMYARFDENLTITEGESTLNDEPANGSTPSVAANGADYGVAWDAPDQQGNGRILFQKPGPSSQVTVWSGVEVATEPSLVAADGCWAVAWAVNSPAVGSGGQGGVDMEYHSIYLRLLDPDGMPLGEPIVVPSPDTAAQPSLVWTGTHFAIAWRNGIGGTSLKYVECVP